MSDIMIKSQSAMEYLMTYGWAILIVAVVLAALFELGVFNPMTFAPKASPGSCQVVRPEGAGTTNFISLEGECNGELPQYVAQFNGQSGISTANIEVTTANVITETAWVYLYQTTQAYSGIAYYGAQSACGQTFAPYMQPTGLPGLSDWCNSFDPSGTGNFNRWDFVAFTQNGSVVRLYYNNENFSGSLTTDTLDMPVGTATPVYIGTGQLDAGQYFHGYISNIQVYNTTLSTNDVQALYQEGIGGAPIKIQNLMGWWPLNGNANDYSGNNNDGTPTSVTYTSNWYSSYTPP
jgi:hypothetical protein